MDPISAFRSFISPGLGAGLKLPLPGEATGTKAIPLVELEKLLPGAGPPPLAAPGAAGASFEKTIGQLVGEVNDRQAVAGEAVSGLLTGQNVSLHQAMIAMEEASVSFQLMVEVRNKLLESYQELMRMQI